MKDGYTLREGKKYFAGIYLMITPDLRKGINLGKSEYGRFKWKKCVNCPEMYLTTHKKQRYCSMQCYGDYRYKDWQKKLSCVSTGITQITI